jgi:hypothetical protein
VVARAGQDVWNRKLLVPSKYQPYTLQAAPVAIPTTLSQLKEYTYYIQHKRYESYLCCKFYHSLRVGHAKEVDFEHTLVRIYDQYFPCTVPTNSVWADTLHLKLQFCFSAAT